MSCEPPLFFCAREIGQGDALGDLAAQINELAGDLRVRRYRESETFALLERVIESMELQSSLSTPAAELQLTNPAARKMLQLPASSTVDVALQVHEINLRCVSL